MFVPLMLLAPAVPMLLAFNLPPSPTLLNQCLATGLWGAVVFASDASTDTAAAVRDDWALVVAAIVLAVCAALSGAAASLPAPIAISAALLIGCAAVVSVLGATIGRHSDAPKVFAWFATGLVAAGVVSAVIALIQVYLPSWSDGRWIAQSTLPGRAVGNLRQPNHLSTLLLWSLVGAVGLHELRRLRPGFLFSLALFLVVALVLSGSRTGALGTLLLSLWALVDHRLTKPARVLLLLAPILYAAAWGSIAARPHVPSGTEDRLVLRSNGDFSSSRFGIWSNALALLGDEPGAGVGFGEFNLAWTLTAFPDRPVAFFDHTHNLALQFAVELGYPIAVLMLALLTLALFQAWRRAWRAEGQHGIAGRTSWVVVLMIGLHSMLEYPLWYTYFLLPTAFAWGFCLAGTGPVQSAVNSASLSARSFRPAMALGLTMAIGAVAAALDYRQVVVIYDPPEDAAPLEERIARGQRSPLFGHHADYAAATAFGPPKAPLSPSQELAFKRAPHQLLDVRLMIAWSQALAAQGELDKARWLAARIREFRNPGADEYFAPCSDPAQSTQEFQCQPPTREVHWREFVQR
ncbi:MAG: O-antigen ligase C-terminal domain-containing protein [Burkholderiaceae bacterium]|nr:O-antigen ligase C-terminal domain-containing protein [Burkholderiaceae bacterium]